MVYLWLMSSFHGRPNTRVSICSTWLSSIWMSKKKSTLHWPTLTQRMGFTFSLVINRLIDLFYCIFIVHSLLHVNKWSSLLAIIGQEDTGPWLCQESRCSGVLFRDSLLHRQHILLARCLDGRTILFEVKDTRIQGTVNGLLFGCHSQVFILSLIIDVALSERTGHNKRQAIRTRCSCHASHIFRLLQVRDQEACCEAISLNV